MHLTRDRIEALIPHAGTMLMIDHVATFDEKAIHCVSERHRKADNPLRRQGRLSAHHAVEFAAQAAAIHGGLMSKSGGAPLRALAAIRKAEFSRPWLDDLPGPLEIASTIVLSDAQAAVYGATLIHEGERIAAMRLTLMTIGESIDGPFDKTTGAGDMPR